MGWYLRLLLSLGVFCMYKLLLIPFLILSCTKNPVRPETEFDARVCYEHKPCLIVEQYEMTSVIQCGDKPTIIENVLLDEPIYCW